VLAGQLRVPGVHPDGEALLEGHRVQARKDALEGVVAGNPVGQFEKTFEPVLAFLAEQGDLLKVIGSGDDGADSDDQDRLKGMTLAPVDARVFELAKMAKQGKRLGHANPP
jgi:hypothetical protein